MKQNYLQKSIAAIWAIAFLLVAYSCSQIETFEPNMDSNDLMQDGSKFNLTGPLVEPINWAMRGRPDGTPGQDKDKDPNGGNVECSEVGDFEYSSGRNNYNDGEFENEWPEGLKVEVIDGEVKWEFTAPEGYCLASMAVIVKGGPAANVYIYSDGEISNDDNRLVAPNNASGKPAALSNLTFCWNLVEAPKPPTPEDDQEKCFEDDLVLTANATTEEEGVDIVWYDEEFGGKKVEDPSLDKVGTITYWAEAVRNGCASARVPVTLTIWALPVAPESNGDQDEEACDGLNKLTASVKAADGTSIVWYDKDGNEVGDPSLNYDESKGGVQTATFYAEAVYDETGCVSADRTAVTLTLRACPTITPPSNSPCVAGTAFAGEEGELIKSGGWFYLMNYSGSEVSYKLWSSQSFEAGTVTLTPNGDNVDVKVDLNLGYVFKDGDNVYVHGYKIAPTTRPVGGQPGTSVTYAKGSASSSPFTVTVPRNEAIVFAVHVNVECGD